ncbi:clustered mitochondria protein isoform X4 [Fagus crenata]
MTSPMEPDDIAIYAAKEFMPLNNFTSLCTTVDKIQSDGLFHDSNPLHFSMPLMLLQVTLATGLILLTKLLLKPLNQPIVVSQILEAKLSGKSNKGRNRRGAHNTTNFSESVVSSDAPPKDNLSASKLAKADANGVPTVEVSTDEKPEVKESETENAAGQQKQGEVVSSDAPPKDKLSASEPAKADANGVPTVEVSTNEKPEVKESETENAAGQQKQGEGSYCMSLLLCGL